MKLLWTIALALLMHPVLHAQVTIKGNESDIRITPVYHGTMVIEWDGYIILVDPYGGAERLAAYQPVNLILYTHDHQDHLEMKTLLGLEFEDSDVIAPKSVISKLDTLDFLEKITMVNGESRKHDRVVLEAVPAYNLPEGSGGHAKGDGNGYILTIDGKRIYISGDTEDIPEMRQLKDIDAAFICMNQPYTMTVKQAADAVLEFEPDMVFPYHYRGKTEKSDVKEFKRIVNSKNKNIEVQLLEWYPEKPE